MTAAPSLIDRIQQRRQAILSGTPAAPTVEGTDALLQRIDKARQRYQTEKQAGAAEVAGPPVAAPPPQPSQAAPVTEPEPEVRKGFFKSIGHGLTRGTVETGRQLAAAEPRVAYEFATSQPGIFKTARQIAEFAGVKDPMKTLVAKSREWLGLQPAMSKALQEVVESHPEWTPQKIESVADLLSNPNALVEQIAATVPYMATALGASIATGSPAGAAIVAYAVEGQQAYENAKAQGATDEQAEEIAHTVGTINGAIEALSLGEVLRFAKGGKNIVAQIAKRLVEGKIAAARNAGIRLTTEFLGVAAVESLQEAVQGGTEEITTAVTLGKPIQAGFTWRRVLEAIIGGTAGVLFGGAGRAAGVVVKGGKAEVQAIKETEATSRAIEQVIERAEAGDQQAVKDLEAIGKVLSEPEAIVPAAPAPGVAPGPIAPAERAAMEVPVAAEPRPVTGVTPPAEARPTAPAAAAVAPDAATIQAEREADMAAAYAAEQIVLPKVVYHATTQAFGGLPSRVVGRAEFFEQGEPAGIFYSADRERAASSAGLAASGQSVRIVEARVTAKKPFIVDAKTAETYWQREMTVTEQWLKEAAEISGKETAEGFAERDAAGNLVNFLGGKAWKGRDQGFPDWSIAERLAEQYRAEGYDAIYDTRKGDFIALADTAVAQIAPSAAAAAKVPPGTVRAPEVAPSPAQTAPEAKAEGGQAWEMTQTNPDGSIIYRGFHGTFRERLPAKDIKTFGGIHAGTETAARERLEAIRGSERQGRPGGERVIPVEIRLQKPYGSFANPIGETELFALVNLPERLAALKIQGYDGIIYANIGEDPGTISVVAFNRGSLTAPERPGLRQPSAGVSEAPVVKEAVRVEPGAGKGLVSPPSALTEGVSSPQVAIDEAIAASEGKTGKALKAVIAAVAKEHGIDPKTLAADVVMASEIRADMAAKEGAAQPTGPGKAVKAGTIAPRDIETEMGEEGSASAAPLVAAVRAAPGALSKAWDWTTSLFSFSAPLSRRPVGKQVVLGAEEADRAARSLYGEVDNQIVDAYDALGAQGRRWFKSHDEEGWSNGQKMVEQDLAPPDAGTGRWLETENVVRGRTGDEAERVGVLRFLPDLQEYKPFQRAASGRYFRMWTPDIQQAMVLQVGPTWDALVAHLYRHNPETFGTLERTDAGLKEWLGPGAEAHVGSLEHVRFFKNVPAYMRMGDAWVPVMETDPLLYLRRAARQQSKRIYWIEQFGQNAIDGRLDVLRKQYVAQGGTPEQFDNYVRAYFDRPVGTGRVHIDPRNPLVRYGKPLVSVPLGLMHTSLSVTRNIAQFLMLVPRTAGVGNTLLGLGHLIANPRQSIRDNATIGAVPAAAFLRTVREGHVIEDLSRMLSDVVGSPFQGANRLQAHIAANAGKVLVQSWQTHGLGETELNRAERLRLTPDEIADARRGVISHETEAKIIQNVVGMTQFFTERGTRRGWLEKDPLLRFVFTYNQYAVGTGKAVSLTVDEAYRAVRSGNPVRMYATGRDVILLLVGAFGAGMVGEMLNRALKGKPLKREDETWWDLAKTAMWQATLLGPVQRSLDAAEFAGGSMEKLVLGLAPQVSALVGLLQALLPGFGEYGKFPMKERTWRWFLKNTPALRGAANWYERAMYPDIPDYYKTRAQARQYAEKSLGKEARLGWGVKEPVYDAVGVAARRNDLEDAIEEAHKGYAAAEAKGGAKAVLAFQKGLRASLGRGRPVPFAQDDIAGFLALLPEADRPTARAAQTRFERLRDIIAPSLAEVHIQTVVGFDGRTRRFLRATELPARSAD